LVFCSFGKASKEHFKGEFVWGEQPSVFVRVSASEKELATRRGFGRGSASLFIAWVKNRIAFRLDYAKTQVANTKINVVLKEFPYIAFTYCTPALTI
jgi:hypothetical protein